ncbi:MAG: cytochrome-c peroxidase [Flavobacteriales bacterium]|nr:cytochrome-c peroxidase [Flavobacteriales bacterium]
MNKLLLTLILILSVIICSSLITDTTPEDSWLRPTIEFPKDNPLTDASINLGDALFSETLLSRDSTLSCHSCHMTGAAFADHLPLGEGIRGRHVTRNTPTIFNMAFHPYFMIDGKFKTLEEQVLGPINEHKEFDMNPEMVIERLKSLTLYNRLSIEAYGEELSIEVVQKSIANFERILISDNSRFDQFKRGEIELTEHEMNGWKLFKTPELNCIKCHSGYNFTNYAFENNGLFEIYQDSGRALITNQPEDLAKFKVPTLRNIVLTYPYMHNGSFSSLELVIDHYASGGKKHRSQSNFIKGFEISKNEQSALIAFLETLTEERLLSQD